MIRSLHYLKAMGYNFIEKTHPKQKKINDFKSLYLNASTCTLCNFSKLRKHSLMEKKQRSVKLFILGNCAQKSENESGILLESHRGKLLQNEIKNTLRLDRDEFYFSYLFKCFSDGKNDDFSLQSCLPFFWSELELIQPKILLCLGEYVFRSLGFSNFNDIRGEIFPYKNFFILTSFSLEFLERNPSKKEHFINDLMKIKGYL